jgi:CBS domain-containing protein
MASIRALMVTETIMTTGNETVAAAALIMRSNRVGALLVVEDGVVRGLLSERDVLARVVAEGRDPARTRVGDVATREIVTVDAEAPLKAVLEVFREKKFRHLPVMERGKPVGILSTRDLLDYLVEGLERYIDAAKYKSDLAAGVDPYDHLGGSYGR